MSYDAYINRKLSRIPPTGIPHGFAMPDHGLFDHQRALVSWACKRGRAAIFADTGLGKSRMQLAWADAVRLHTGLPVRKWIGKTGTIKHQVGPEAWDVMFTDKVANPVTGKAVAEFQSFHVSELEVEAE